MELKIKVNQNLEEINWNRLTELFEKVQWGHRPPEIIRNTFEKSSKKILFMTKRNL